MNQIYKQPVTEP